MSITVDTINLRFNVTPDYNQQQLQKLGDDLKQSQKDATAARKEVDKYTQKVVNLQGELSTLKEKQAELAKQKTLSTEESKEYDRLSKAIEKTEDSLSEAKEQQNKWSGELMGSIREMRELEQRMQEQTKGTNLYAMSMNQLRERQKDLNAVLNNLSPKNEAYKELKDELDGINQRMKELRQASLDMHEGEDIAEMSANQLTERLQALNAAFRDCNPEDDDFKRYAQAIKDTQKQLDLLNEATKESKEPVLKFHNEVKLADLTLDELQERLQALTIAFRTCKPNSPEHEQYAKRIRLTKEQIEYLNKTIENTKESLDKQTSGWKYLIKTFNDVGWAIEFVSKGINAIKNWAQPFIDEARKYSDTVADVAKYTGQSIAEVERMNKELAKIDTRTSTEQLNELAGVAGRLGITAERDILGFVDAADKINTALGDDLGEGAIDAIGKMTMVFGEDKTKGLNGAMLATGSALNVLGAASSANTGYIADFTSKLAAVAVQARISQTDIMGYASALSQAGETGETAASVLTQFLVKMFSDPAKFAKAAKLDVKEFTDLIRTDANQAVLTFLDSMKKAGGFEQLAPMLKGLKIQGTQAVPVLTELANGLDNITEAQRTARNAYNEGTSIIEEFNEVNQTAQAQYEKTEKAMANARRELGERLLPIINSIEQAGVTGIQLLGRIISKAIQWRGAIGALAAVLTAYASVQALVWANQKRIIAMEAIQKGYHAVMTTLLATRTTIVSAYNLALSLMQGRTIAAARAQVTLNAAMSASVFGVIAAGLTAAAIAGKMLYDRLTSLSKAQRTLNDIHSETTRRMSDERAEMDELVSTVKSLTASENERKRALETINGKLAQQHLGNLTEEEIRTGKAKKTLDLYNQSLMDQIENEIILAKLKEARARQMNAENGEFDTSFLQDAKAVIAGIGSFAMGNGFQNGYKLVMENIRQDIIDEERENIKAMEQEQEKNRARRRNRLTAGGHTPDEADADQSGDNGPTHYPTKSDSELKKEKQERAKLRKELEAEAKQAYDEELLRLKQQYQGRQNLQDEWHRLQLSAEERYINKIGKIREDYGASEADKMEVSNQALDLVIKKANHQREVQEKEVNRSLQAEDRRYWAEQISESQKRLDGEYNTEEEYNLRMQELEIEHQKRMLEIKRAAGQDVSREQKQLLDMEYELQKQRNAKTENETQTAQNGNNDLLHLKFDETNSFDKMRELNEQYFRDGLISWQQYYDNVNEIARQETDKRKAIEQAAVDGVNNLLSSASSLFSAMQQRETAQVDAKYKKLIAAAKKQGKDTTKLEEQQEQEKAAIQKKYADRNFQIQVLQIIGNTAQGISKTIADLGMPWAIPFVAMAAAAGAMQLASAKAAADQAAGLYEGGYSDDYEEGYTRKGNPREQAGVIPVHRNEFVANHRAVANPEVRPVLDVIDRHQKQGDISMLNATRMLEEAYGSGRYRGGYTRGGEPGNGSGEDAPQYSPAQDQEAVSLLRSIERNTARSMTVRTLREEIAHEEQLERNARR